MRRVNPWWKNPAAIQSDDKIVKWASSAIRYDPPLRHEIQYEFEPDNTVVYTLRGPRQVGKTTLIKLQIMDLLDRRVLPWNILYYPLDLTNTPKDIVDIIDTYMKISRKSRSANRSYIFLDEASSVPDWQKGIKFLVDNAGLYNCTVLVTGSHSINIKNASERLPGRKGKTSNPYDNILLPMKFSEYSMLGEYTRNIVIENDLREFPNRLKTFNGLLDGEVDEKLYSLYSSQNEIDDLLDEYMITGGLPNIISEKHRTNMIADETYKNYLDSITGQWTELSKNEILLKQFAGIVVKNLGSPMSWSGMSRDADLGSTGTAQNYTDTLHSMFILHEIELYGEEKKIPRFRNNRKIYFQDPFFLHMFYGWTHARPTLETSLEYRNDEANKGRIVEGIVADHLVRWAFLTSQSKQTYDPSHHVFYWRDDQKREVDFVLYDGDRIEVPIEVKFRNNFNGKDLAPVVRFLSSTGNKRGLVLSKTLLEVRQDYVIIPASLFLLLI